MLSLTNLPKELFEDILLLLPLRAIVLLHATSKVSNVKMNDGKFWKRYTKTRRRLKWKTYEYRHHNSGIYEEDERAWRAYMIVEFIKSKETSELRFDFRELDDEASLEMRTMLIREDFTEKHIDKITEFNIDIGREEGELIMEGPPGVACTLCCERETMLDLVWRLVYKDLSLWENIYALKEFEANSWEY